MVETPPGAKWALVEIHGFNDYGPHGNLCERTRHDGKKEPALFSSKEAVESVMDDPDYPNIGRETHAAMLLLADQVAQTHELWDIRDGDLSEVLSNPLGI